MNKHVTKIIIIFAALFFGGGFANAQMGPITTSVDLEPYTKVFYVSVSKGSDKKGRGSLSAPWASISKALAAAKKTRKSVAILVAQGIYHEETLMMTSGVHMFGGYRISDWSRDVWSYRTVLDGEGKHRILVAADKIILDGFEVKNGLVRGAGAGVFIKGTSPTLSNNFFAGNKTLAPEEWTPEHWHETANNGAAVYCTKGGNPDIHHNIFAGNKTETGRGAGIAFDDHCNGSITHNVMMNNVAGLDDPMRSSDGGAISVFNWSSPVIADNIILSNAALSHNDGGGIFVALWSSAKLRNNLIIDNEAGDDAGGLFVGGQEHRYDAPLDPLPARKDFFVEVTGNIFYGNRNSSHNSGATRITMETRGLIAHNIAALNEGFYIQRSEALVENNTILENLIFIETKKGLKPSVFKNNIIWGNVDYDTKASVTESLFRDGFEGKGNIKGAPSFIDDILHLSPLSSSFIKNDFQTKILLSQSLAGKNLVNRVVVSGDKWGVVKSLSGNTLTLWGDLSGVTQLTVVSTFTQTKSSKGAGKGADQTAHKGAGYQPKRINKAIELLAKGQPVYYAAGYGGYEEGLKMGGTWADYILYNMEHKPLDFSLLRQFMRGLVDAGPTKSGHRTPAVIVVLPLLGLDETTVKSGGWMIEQALAQGVHGVELARARDPQAVKRFVQAARYPIYKRGIDVVGEGLRGWGSQFFASWVWGISPAEYLKRADVWPLDPNGEIMLGVKIEDRIALENTEETLKVPGLAFAEHGPRDMSLSYGHLEGRADPPMPAEVDAAGTRVLKAVKENGLFFLDNVLPDNVNNRLDRGVMIGAGRREDAAEKGRAHTNRKMPW